MQTVADESNARIFEYAGHWLVRRSDTPNYHIYWCRPGTRRVRRKSTDTRDLEQAKRRLIEFAEARRKPNARDPSIVPVLDALGDYIEHRLAEKPSQATARNCAKIWVEYFDQQDIHFIDQVTWEAQERFVEWRKDNYRTSHGGEIASGTIARDLGVLRAALKAYHKRGRVASVPFVMGVPQSPPRERFLTIDEADRLLAECHQPHLHLYVTLALHTLQRPGAILGLRVTQVDFVLNRINFLQDGDRQSNKRRPVIPITPSLRNLLRIGCQQSESGFVIEWKGVPVRCIRNAFKKAASRAGLHDVTPYTLRHTGATLLAAAGVSMREIAGMLGHTTTRTTEYHYAKHHPDFLGGATSAIERIFGSARRVVACESQVDRGTVIDKARMIPKAINPPAHLSALGRSRSTSRRSSPSWRARHSDH